MVACFVIIFIIIMINNYIYIYIRYINYGFRFIDTYPFANSRDTPGSHYA